jgi:uncharacterized lipoprotein YajG
VVAPKPVINIPSASVGEGRSVFLTVSDERTLSVLGGRGGAEVTVGPNLAETVQSSISEGLQRQGFKPISSAEANSPELHVEIRDIFYVITRGILTDNLRVACGLKVVCSNGCSRLYEKLCRGERLENISSTPTEAENEVYVNDALSKAINSVLQDQQLIQSLAR